MNRKIAAILLVIFTLLTFVKISTINYYVDSNEDTTKKFEKVVGDLQYKLMPFQKNLLKIDFAMAVKQNNRQMQKTDIDKAKTKEEDNSKENNSLKQSEDVMKADFFSVHLNKKLNKYSKKILIKDKTSDTDLNQSKSQVKVDDTFFSDLQQAENMTMSEDVIKQSKTYLNNLKNFISSKDYDSIKGILQDVNPNDSESIENARTNIINILSSYDTISSDIIASSLLGYYKVLGYYTVEKGNITPMEPLAIKSPMLSQDDQDKQLRIINKALLLLDGIYPRRVNRFFIFTDGQKGLSSIATDYKNKGLPAIGIDINDFPEELGNDFEKTRFNHCIIYELGKILLLNNNQIDYTKSNNNFELIKNFTKQDSYIKQFYARFWGDYLYRDSLIADKSKDPSARNYFYLRHQSEFENLYVSKDPYKDLLESFVSFVLEEKPTDSSIKSDKVRFFYEFEELVNIKDRIDKNIKNMEEA